MASLMRMRSLLLVTVIMLVSFAARAQDPAAELTQRLESLRSLSADFVQLIQDPSGQKVQETHGVMSLQKPGRFYWQAQQPFPQTLVSDGETLWLYDPDLEQVTIRPMDERVTHTPALLLSGSAKALTQNFEVSRDEREGTVSYTLHPTTEDTLFEVLRMSFKQDRLVSIQMEDSLGQRTLVELHNVQYNMAIPAARFDFEIPDGVDVIREQAGEGV